MIAAQTAGVATPANVVSVLGGALVLVGLLKLADRSFIGVVYIVAGRLCDILDGLVAEHTGTKSLIGEGVDALLDKLELYAALLLLTAYSIIPIFFTVTITLQALSVSIVAIVALLRRLDMHPYRIGKIATAACWVAIVLFVWSAIVKKDFHTTEATALSLLGYLFTIVSLVLGLIVLQKSAHYLLTYSKNTNPGKKTLATD